MVKQRIEIDGTRFRSLEEFYDEVSERLIPRAVWGQNLDAFNDILRGGFGTPEDGFVLVWRNHALSQDRLGYAETVRQLRRGLKSCHSSNIPSVRERLAAAEKGQGPTVFDRLIQIIRDHGPGGEQASDNVELVLELPSHPSTAISQWPMALPDGGWRMENAYYVESGGPSRSRALTLPRPTRSFTGPGSRTVRRVH